MANTNFMLSLQLGHLLADKGLKIALAESCTGGGLAQEITAVTGSSQWLDRAFVTYSNEAKIELLGVRAETLKQHGAVSHEIAAEMALGTIKHSHADISISVTGIAGPTGGTAKKPVGLVIFGLAHKNGQVATQSCIFTGGRKNVRVCAIHFALDWLLTKITSLT